MNQIIPSQSRKVERLLFIVATGTTLMCFATQCVGLATGKWRLFGLTDFFGLDTERSFPTWFTAIIWFLVFDVCRNVAIISRERKFFGLHWTVLCGLFLIMSIDEVAAAHERIGWWLSDAIHAKGYLFFPFVIPGAILALLFVSAYSLFLWKLPRKTAGGIFLSGVIYVIAVIGLESLAGNWTYHHGGMDSKKLDMTYFLLSNTEEYLEMLAGILMFRTLSLYRESL